MKNTLFTLSFGLAISVVATSASALDGTINFAGKINSATCPIEIIDPVSGQPGNLVELGEVDVSEFAGQYSEAGGRGFQMRITPNTTCIITGPANATVTFTSVQGGAGAYYGLKPLPGAARGVAIALRDTSGNLLPGGSASAVYPLSDTDPTLMYFSASYIATGATVTAGPANADVSFRVDIN